MLISALRLQTFDSDALAVWRALERGEQASAPRRCAGSVVVWRRHFDVFHIALAPDEARAMAAALRGRTMAEVCACFEEREDPAQAAFEAVGSWVREGMIVGVRAGSCRSTGGSRRRGSLRRSER